jgi:hypothetical protein
MARRGRKAQVGGDGASNVTLAPEVNKKLNEIADDLDLAKVTVVERLIGWFYDLPPAFRAVVMGRVPLTLMALAVDNAKKHLDSLIKKQTDVPDEKKLGRSGHKRRANQRVM